jgi:hypothetical protein
MEKISFAGFVAICCLVGTGLFLFLCFLGLCLGNFTTFFDVLK